MGFPGSQKLMAAELEICFLNLVLKKNWRSVSIALLLKKYPQKKSSDCGNISVSRGQMLNFYLRVQHPPLLWSERCSPKLNFFQLLTHFDVNTWHTCSYRR